MNYEDIWLEAVIQGNIALLATKPTPIGIYFADLYGKRIGETEIIEEGNCGGAYVIVTDFRSPFVAWAKKNKPLEISKNYEGKGYRISLFEAHRGYRGQSAERYEACAEAFAAVLERYGVNCRVRAYLT